MDWVVKGSQPGFHELIFHHLGAVKAEKALKTLALAKIFPLVKLKSIAPSGDAKTFKRKVTAVLHGTSTRHRLPSPLDDVINGITQLWAVTRLSNPAPGPRGPTRTGVRALTLREAALIDNRPQPLFVKTAIQLPKPVGTQLPALPDSPSSPATFLPRQDIPSSQSSNLTMDSFSQSSKPSYIQWGIFLQTNCPKKRKPPAEPPLVNFPYIEISAASPQNNPSLWEISLLFREHSKTFASLGRTMCPFDIAKAIVATAFSKRAS